MRLLCFYHRRIVLYDLLCHWLNRELLSWLLIVVLHNFTVDQFCDEVFILALWCVVDDVPLELDLELRHDYRVFHIALSQRLSVAASKNVLLRTCLIYRLVWSSAVHDVAAVLTMFDCAERDGVLIENLVLSELGWRELLLIWEFWWGLNANSLIFKLNVVECVLQSHLYHVLRERLLKLRLRLYVGSFARRFGKRSSVGRLLN